MSDTIRGLIEAWDGKAVLSRYDRESEAWVFIAIHSDLLGIPVGGSRMMVYPAPEDGLRDALRLAEGMTRKWASIDVPFGGGKAVLALSRPLHGDERDRLLQRYAQLLNSLRGASPRARTSERPPAT